LPDVKKFHSSQHNEDAMASLTKVTETKRANRDKKMALRRRRRVQKLQKQQVAVRKELTGV
jgi:hypothetical protein